MNAMRSSLGTVFFVASAIAILLILTGLLGLNRGIIGSIALTCVAYFISRRRCVKAILLFEVVLLACLWAVTLVDLRITGPYVRWYNENKLRLATDAKLVGDRQDKVETVLGKADVISTSIYSPGVTYFYAPYPHFPAAAVQVHCRDGKVQSIELYDD